MFLACIYVGSKESHLRALHFFPLQWSHAMSLSFLISFKKKNTNELLKCKQRHTGIKLGIKTGWICDTDVFALCRFPTVPGHMPTWRKATTWWQENRPPRGSSGESPPLICHFDPSVCDKWSFFLACAAKHVAAAAERHDLCCWSAVVLSI